MFEPEAYLRNMKINGISNDLIREFIHKGLWKAALIEINSEEKALNSRAVALYDIKKHIEQELAYEEKVCHE